ncbi:MAG: hypothetical protein HGB04_03880 [Chlorobiaceae bacterium]|nr:hypothetical protein [Chlorobiaceae bacterium]
MATIETEFSRGTVREAFTVAAFIESCLTYAAFRERVRRARREGASSLELAALSLCVTVEENRSATEKAVKSKIVKIREAKKQEA